LCAFQVTLPLLQVVTSVVPEKTLALPENVPCALAARTVPAMLAVK
jgi:hypothetical protein